MIELQHVHKSFRLKQHSHAVWGRLLNVWSSASHHALQDVSISISQGESVALVGVNGSGKSTLLKTISGVVHPSSGTVSVTGRIGGVIEIGAGFHPDLSGIENVFLQGTVLGMSRQDIRTRLDDILSFAELGRFIHSPVRHYSMGMFLRLGFAIAVHCEPDIFLVDEALAVGDGYFQWKCLQKIDELKHQGKTLLFVSHIPNLSESICARAIWVDQGRVVADGPTSEIVARYNSFLFRDELEAAPSESQWDVTAFVKRARIGRGDVIITQVRTLDEHGVSRHVFETGHPLAVELQLEARSAVSRVEVGVAVEAADTPVSLTRSSEHGAVFDVPQGRSIVRLKLPSLCLHAGNYYLSVGLADDAKVNPTFYDVHVKMHNFTVVESSPGIGYTTRLLQMPASVNVTARQ